MLLFQKEKVRNDASQCMTTCSQVVDDMAVTYVTSRSGALNLLQRKIPNASVKMATVQQKARLWFHESKSIVTVQRRFRLQYRNCQSPCKNYIKC
ncbi:hypothetical protein AVEN_143384-1 [Araneus ventricosus]|uniref:DUF4817 domain-containing protein n=1 Tax=Araneus ventricosus TaxID=182803 RepID=A0A4Y2AE80_ARAVE|nr:hypothetical protein AVEN_143384-1 [Araneus ventricosus]